jgi:predicted nuclease of predicted toxin-antitoxin system
LADADDSVIFEFAERERRVVVSADTDFGTILALRDASLPSVILFRGATPKRPEGQVGLLLANLAQVTTMLERGVIVVIEPQRMRVRTLPINAPRDRSVAEGQ